jgi:hypothetical protein
MSIFGEIRTEEREVMEARDKKITGCITFTPLLRLGPECPWEFQLL